MTVAESGAEAIAALERNPDIDIVLMDIMMPVMDGYDTIRAIRKISGFKVLPIVAVTGKAAAGERQRCLDSGADDYIPKPVDTGAAPGRPDPVAADSASRWPPHEHSRRLARHRPWTRRRTPSRWLPPSSSSTTTRRSGWR